MSRVEGFVVQEAALELESWSDGADAPVRWRTLLSADRTPSAALTVGVAEVAPGGSGRLHRHAQPEAYYVLSGRGVVTIDGREHAVHPGSAVFVRGRRRARCAQCRRGRASHPLCVPDRLVRGRRVRVLVSDAESRELMARYWARKD